MVCSKCNKDIELYPKRRVCRKCYNYEKLIQKKKRNLLEREGECSKCLQTKKICKGGYWCKECKNKYEQLRRSYNRKAINEKEKEYYQKKKENLVEIEIDITKSKICTKCKIEKKLDKFYLVKMKSAIRPACKKCELKERKKNYNDNRVERIKQTTNYQNNKRKTDPIFKLERNMRCRLYHAIRSQKTNKTNKTFKLVGCNLLYLKNYIEAKFTQGMTWENYGDWHIDHIKPCCSFDLSKEEEQKKCFHFTNLQPLWAADNLSKGGKF
jgi:hypothetical protein